MAFVRTLNDIIKNLETLEQYITAGSKEEVAYAKEIIQKATDMVVYKVEGVNHFAPSIFVAYPGNTMKNELATRDDDHSDANKKVAKVVGKEAFTNGIMETNFAKYCSSLGVKPPKQERLYWRLYEGGSYLEL
ncbi:MAG: hypothetical protein ACPGU4_09465 [Flavobacteriales bacterium]